MKKTQVLFMRENVEGREPFADVEVLVKVAAERKSAVNGDRVTLCPDNEELVHRMNTRLREIHEETGRTLRIWRVQRYFDTGSKNIPSDEEICRYLRHSGVGDDLADKIEAANGKEARAAAVIEARSAFTSRTYPLRESLYEAYSGKRTNSFSDEVIKCVALKKLDKPKNTYSFRISRLPKSLDTIGGRFEKIAEAKQTKEDSE